MVFYKVFSNFSRTIPRTSLLSAQRIPQQQFHSLLVPQSTNKLIPVQVNFLCPSINYSTPKLGFSSSASTTEIEGKKGNNMHNGDSTNDYPTKTSEEAKDIDQHEQAKPADQTEDSRSISDSQSQTVDKRSRTAFSDSASESDLSLDDLIKRVAEMEELLKLKQKEIEKMQNKHMQTCAEIKNTIKRTYADIKNIMNRMSHREADTLAKLDQIKGRMNILLGILIYYICFLK